MRSNCLAMWGVMDFFPFNTSKMVKIGLLHWTASAKGDIWSSSNFSSKSSPGCVTVCGWYWFFAIDIFFFSPFVVRICFQFVKLTFICNQANVHLIVNSSVKLNFCSMHYSMLSILEHKSLLSFEHEKSCIHSFPRRTSWVSSPGHWRVFEQSKPYVGWW